MRILRMGAKIGNAGQITVARSPIAGAMISPTFAGMKLLLCVHRLSDHQPLLDMMAQQSGQPLSPQPDPQSATYLFQTRYMQHEIDICETGYGAFQTGYKLTKALARQRYHLALRAGMAHSYKADIPVGTIVNVIKDKPGDQTYIDGAPADLYEAGLLSIESFPHYREAFINMNNSYMNVMLPFKKVVSLTTGTYGEPTGYETRRDKYKADIETRDGLSFVYACMYERQPFYQLCCVERNLATGDTDGAKALEHLNNTLLDILQKL